MHTSWYFRRQGEAEGFCSWDWGHNGYKVDLNVWMARYILQTWQRVKRHEGLDRQDWYKAAVAAADWAIAQQNADGGLPQVVEIATGKKSNSVVCGRALVGLPIIARITGDKRYLKVSEEMEKFLRAKVEGRFWYTGMHPDLPPNDFEQDSIYAVVEYWLNKHDRTGQQECLDRAVANAYYALLYWCPKQLSWVKSPTQCAHSEQEHFNQYSVYCYGNRKIECLARLARQDRQPAVQGVAATRDANELLHPGDRGAVQGLGDRSHLRSMAGAPRRIPVAWQPLYERAGDGPDVAVDGPWAGKRQRMCRLSKPWNHRATGSPLRPTGTARRGAGEAGPGIQVVGRAGVDPTAERRGSCPGAVGGPTAGQATAVSKSGYLLFSDIPNNAVMKWQEGEAVGIFLKSSGYTGTTPRGGEVGSNGLTLDAAGRLVLCQHGDRRIVRREPDGRWTTLADRYHGKRLSSPNDLVFKSNGDLYFTDPPYGLPKGADDPTRELDFCGVFRVSAADGKLTLLTREMTRPNGIAFSPDEKTLYVSQSDPQRAVWMAFAVKEDGTLGPGRVFYDATRWTKTLKGLPDGMKVDRAGNLFAAGPGGINVFAPDGTLLGRINPDEPTSNCAFGEDGSVLFVTANHYLCRIKTGTKGKLLAPWCEPRPTRL